jgi:hypothetical protein
MTVRPLAVAPAFALLAGLGLAAGTLAGCTSDDASAPGATDGGSLDGTTTAPNDGGTSGADGQAGDAATGSADGSAGDDGGSTGDDGGDSDAGGSSGPCPTGNVPGAITTTNASCLVFTPTITGANATFNHYALSPLSGGNGKLLLFLNGTNAHPSEQIATPTKNFYNAATSLGYQVLALSYHSIETIGMQCNCVDSCYFPSRETVIRGVYQDGGAADLEGDGGIRVDEGIAGRAELALRWLAANDAAHGWSAYLTAAAPSAPPETQIDWTKIVVAGHSQGGGHAAAVGKLFPVARVVQLSATCDTVTPPDECSHTTGTIADATPAAWMTRTDGIWATPATSYWGLDAKTVYDGNTWVSGDGDCFLHAQVWQNEQEPAAQIDDDGGVCGATTSLENHNASIGCEDNFPIWKAMLE